MSLLQKYRKEETKKKTPEKEEGEIKTKKSIKEPIPPREPEKKRTKRTERKETGARSRPVISATVSSELVEALADLTEEKYLNRSKFIEDALKRTIKTEFPDIAERYGF